MRRGARRLGAWEMHRKAGWATRAAWPPRFASGSLCSRLFAATPALAQQSDPIAAIRADRWADAQRAAAHLRRSGGDQAGHLLPAADAGCRDGGRDHRLHGARARTGRTRRCWSGAGRRRSPSDPDLASTLAQCDRNALTLPPAMLHCAEALANAGRNAEAQRGGAPRLDRRHPTRRRSRRSCAAGRAPSGPTTSGRAFSTWPGTMPPRRRDSSPRLDPAHRAAAEARLALQRDAPERRGAARRAAGDRCGAIPA